MRFPKVRLFCGFIRRPMIDEVAHVDPVSPLMPPEQVADVPLQQGGQKDIKQITAWIFKINMLILIIAMVLFCFYRVKLSAEEPSMPVVSTGNVIPSNTGRYTGIRYITKAEKDLDNMLIEVLVVSALIAFFEKLAVRFRFLTPEQLGLQRRVIDGELTSEQLRAYVIERVGKRAFGKPPEASKTSAAGDLLEAPIEPQRKWHV